MYATSEQIPLPRLILYHFYAGFFITGFYLWMSPKVVQAGYPAHLVLLLSEVLILLPLVGGHLGFIAQRSGGFGPLITNRKPMPWGKFLWWTLGGMVVSLAIYVPLYPVGLYLRESVFSWLPPWYFNPGFGTEDMELIA